MIPSVPVLSRSLARGLGRPGTGRTVLVTGGAGFIGSHLCDALLADGHTVRVLDDLSTGRLDRLDRRVDVEIGDVADPVTLRDAIEGVDGVFHLAAIASVARGNEDWHGTHRVNQGAAVRVFDAARVASRDGTPVPVVYASSAAIYGDTGGAVAREDRLPVPLSAYGADKLGCEHHAAVATGVHRVPTLGFRFFNVYGARQDPRSPYSGVISIFADRIASGRPILLHGDGRQTRDFVHVSDAVRHLIGGMRVLLDGTAGDHAIPGNAPGAARVVNVCTGRPTAISDLGRLLGRLRGLDPRIELAPPRPGDIRASVGCPIAATRLLGLRAETVLADGLATLGVEAATVGP